MNELREYDLPGIGRKFVLQAQSGGEVAVVLHQDGRREIYHYDEPDADDPLDVVELNEEEGRRIGSVLAENYGMPEKVSDIEMCLSDLVIDWFAIPSTSPLVGKSIGESQIRAKTGITVVGIMRKPESIANPDAEDRIQAKDTLVTVGKRAQYEAFRQLLGAS